MKQYRHNFEPFFLSQHSLILPSDDEDVEVDVVAVLLTMKSLISVVDSPSPYKQTILESWKQSGFICVLIK